MKSYITPEFVSILITLVLIPMLSLVTKFIILFLKSKVTEVECKSNDAALHKYIKMAESTIESAVVSVNQTFVENMKKNGAFDAKAASESFQMAKNKALSIIGDASVKVLQEAYDDVDAWLDSKIEFFVSQNKSKDSE